MNNFKLKINISMDQRLQADFSYKIKLIIIMEYHQECRIIVPKK